MFQITSSDGAARTGEIKTAHGSLKTPFFMPVATNASVKTLTPQEVKGSGAQVLISNSFILSLKPGTELIKSFGGLHGYMGWDQGIFTDSGGFQILDDYFRQKLSDRGVVFKNPHTGKNSLFTPEDSMRVQHDIGSDVAMALDDVPKATKSKEYVAASIKRTMKWAKRCLETHKYMKKEHGSSQLLFGIAQGGLFDDLRKKSAKEISSLDFDGLAIGGLCIGESKEDMFRSLDAQLSTIDREKPLYFMGLGSPEDIVEAVSRGVDAFDSIYPTKNARRGSLFTRQGQIKIKNKQYRDDHGPIEEGCTCYACKNFTRAYVSQQLSSGEHLGLRLASTHNTHFMQRLMADIRRAISKGEFSEFHKSFSEYKEPKRNSSSFW